MTLRKRLFLIVTSTILLVLAVSFGLAHYFVTSFAKKYVEKRLTFLANQITQNLALPLLLKDKKLAEKLLENALSEEEIIGVEIVTPEGKVWLRKGKSNNARPVRKKIRLLAPAEEALFLSRTAVLGEIVIYYRKNLLQSAVRKFFLLFTFTAIAIATFAGTMVYMAIYRTIAKPLVELNQAVKEVSAGKLDLTISGEGLPETEELARAFNEMLASLKRHQAELHKAYKRMAEQKFLAELGRFSAVVAHEIKNPLGIIKGSVDLLKKENIPREERLRLISFIEDEVLRLDNLVKNFLFYARPIKPNLKKISLKVFLERLKQKSKLHFASEIVELNIVNNIMLETDPDLLFHALYNIVKNAFESGANRIRISAYIENNKVNIDICDNGPGISPENKERIFQPFYTTKSKGSGLGLAVVKKVMEILNGTIEVKTCKELKGTEFKISLPLQFSRCAHGRKDSST